jgi:hypothetical protein
MGRQAQGQGRKAVLLGQTAFFLFFFLSELVERSFLNKVKPWYLLRSLTLRLKASRGLRVDTTAIKPTPKKTYS